MATTCEESGEKRQEVIVLSAVKYWKEQKEVPATGHKEAVTDKAVEPTCETPGKTEGSHCTACGKTLKEQQEIPALGHTETMLVIKATTCEKKEWKFRTAVSAKRSLASRKKFLQLATQHSMDYKTSEEQYSNRKFRHVSAIPVRKQNQRLWKKLTPYVKISVTSLLLKTKQKTTVLKVSGLKSGDSIVSWKSSNTKVVTVSGKTNGTSTVTAGALKGTATITITLKSGLKKTVKVTVQPTTVKTTKISGIPAGVTLKKGQSRVLQPVLAP